MAPQECCSEDGGGEAHAVTCCGYPRQACHQWHADTCSFSCFLLKAADKVREVTNSHSPQNVPKGALGAWRQDGGAMPHGLSPG